MTNAKESVLAIMNHVNYEEKPEVWNFLNEVLSGTSHAAELTDEQNTHLMTTLQDAVTLGSYNSQLATKFGRRQWAMQIATWINTAYLANIAGAYGEYIPV